MIQLEDTKHIDNGALIPKYVLVKLKLSGRPKESMDNTGHTSFKPVLSRDSLKIYETFDIISIVYSA